MNLTKIFLLTLGVFFTQTSPAQTHNKPSDQELTKAILAMDSVLFSQGFNACNFEVWNEIVSQDLEFYDDRTGLNTDRDKEVASYWDRCGKNRQTRIKRRLVNAEVHPLQGYGAVQTGKHEFYLPTEDATVVEEARFIIIWKKTEDSWQVTRVVSYDHTPVNQ